MCQDEAKPSDELEAMAKGVNGQLIICEHCRWRVFSSQAHAGWSCVVQEKVHREEKEHVMCLQE